MGFFCWWKRENKLSCFFSDAGWIIISESCEAFLLSLKIDWHLLFQQCVFLGARKRSSRRNPEVLGKGFSQYLGKASLVLSLVVFLFGFGSVFGCHAQLCRRIFFIYTLSMEISHKHRCPAGIIFRKFSPIQTRAPLFEGCFQGWCFAGVLWVSLSWPAEWCVS